MSPPGLLSRRFFAVVVVVTAVLANKCPYCYSYTDLVTAKQSESQIAHQKIKNTFWCQQHGGGDRADRGL